MNKKILITCPHLSETGGVSNYYNAVIPYLRNYFEVNILEIGSLKNRRVLFHPLLDQLNFQRQANASYDLVHVNPSLNLFSFMRDGIFVWQARKKNIPVLVFFRGWDKTFENHISKYLLWFFRRTYGKAQAFIVLSNEFKLCLEKWLVASPVHIGTTTVSDTLISNFDISLRKYDPTSGQPTRILFLSRIEKDKGIFETIDAINLLSKKGYNVTLTIAGDGTAKKAAEIYVSDLNISQDVIKFVGVIHGENKIRTFINSDIFCLPTSYGEGLPNAVLEAMAFGLPIITCQTGGIADFFEHGKMGYIIDKTNKSEIDFYIEKLINGPSLLTSISQYNNRYATDHFLSSKVADKLRLVYLETLSNDSAL